MTARLLEGTRLAVRIKANLQEQVEQLKSKGVGLRLVSILVGANAGARIYANQQKKACLEVGIDYELKVLVESSTEQDVLKAIQQLNEDDSVTGIVLMMPVPAGMNARELQSRIAPSKDVEAVHPANMGQLIYGRMELSPCTARAAVELLKYSGVELKGKEVVIVGHSEIVGKPLALMLLRSQTEAPTVTVCHIATGDLALHTRRADTLLTAVGKPRLITADMVKDGVIVIDIGINRVAVLDEQGKPVLDEKGRPKKKIVGDVDFESVKEKAGLITPVPGGVGPVTTMMLLLNTVEAARKQRTEAQGS